MAPNSSGKAISRVDFTDPSSAPALLLISERLPPDVRLFIRPSTIELNVLSTLRPSELGLGNQCFLFLKR
jgi:hypothetical protein